MTCCEFSLTTLAQLRAYSFGFSAHPTNTVVENTLIGGKIRGMDHSLGR